MQPSGRIIFNYPIYVIDVLPGDKLVIAGGGGTMKSGIPNKCSVLSFDPLSASLKENSSLEFSDTVVALAASGSTVRTVVGRGVKNLSWTNDRLSSHSSFRHDLRVSSSHDQSAIAVSKDSSILVVASDEGHVVSVSLPHYEQLFSGRMHEKGIIDLAISQDGSLVATTGRDCAAYLWDSGTGLVVQSLKPVMPPALRTHVRSVRFCDAQTNVFFTAESNPRKGGWIAAWRKQQHSQTVQYDPITSFKASTDAITACAVNHTGLLVAISSSEGHVSLLNWNGSSFACLWSTETKTDWIAPPTPPHSLPVTGIRFSESDEFLFTASADSSVAAWTVRRPRDWRRITHTMFCLISVLVGLFAVLVAEDPFLPSALRNCREHLHPQLDPHLSRLQASVRPFLRDTHTRLHPYFSEMYDTVQPHLTYVGERIISVNAMARKHRVRYESTLDKLRFKFTKDKPSRRKCDEGKGDLAETCTGSNTHERDGDLSERETKRDYEERNDEFKEVGTDAQLTTGSQSVASKIEDEKFVDEIVLVDAEEDTTTDPALSDRSTSEKSRQNYDQKFPGDFSGTESALGNEVLLSVRRKVETLLSESVPIPVDFSKNEHEYPNI